MKKGKRKHRTLRILEGGVPLKKPKLPRHRHLKEAQAAFDALGRLIRVLPMVEKQRDDIRHAMGVIERAFKGHRFKLPSGTTLTLSDWAQRVVWPR
jgi:hypothetical protein